MTALAATAAYEELAAAVRGDLIMPADPGYDQARAVYNAMIDKRPAAIVRCRDTADVITCVRFARAHGIEIAVRGGGHNAGGLGVWDGALVIDMSLLRSTTVSPGNHTVRADAGCTWGDVDHATTAFASAPASGNRANASLSEVTLTALHQRYAAVGRRQLRGRAQARHGGLLQVMSGAHTHHLLSLIHI